MGEPIALGIAGQARNDDGEELRVEIAGQARNDDGESAMTAEKNNFLADINNHN